MAEVIVLKPGYAIWEGYASQKACGTITLIKSKVHNIIVDTGNSQCKDLILKKLKENKLKTDDIDFVICTHSDIDHIGNLNLFPNTTFIGGSDVMQGDLFKEFFKEKYVIDEDVCVIPTPGHDSRSISVIVKTDKGIIAIVGDLFEYEKDWETPDSESWEPWSQDKQTQVENRIKIWKLADYIVPGHGDVFKVDKSVNIMKRK